jgi:hypothetical protein
MMPGIHRASLVFQQAATLIASALVGTYGADATVVQGSMLYTNGLSQESGGTFRQPPFVNVIYGPEAMVEPEVTPFIDAVLTIFVDIVCIKKLDDTLTEMRYIRTLVEEAMMDYAAWAATRPFVIMIRPVSAEAPILDSTGDAVLEVTRTTFEVTYRRTRGAPAT